MGEFSIKPIVFEERLYNMGPFFYVGMQVMPVSTINEGEFMSSWKRDDEGFTGLEAAIVLIAFVVVAAVFSYVVLGAGFFTTQKSQEVVHTGVQQASSTLEIIGNVYGIQKTSGNAIDLINFSVGLAPGGTAVDFEKVVMTYSNKSVLKTLDSAPGTSGWPNSQQWGITAVQNRIGAVNNLLEPGEQFTITCNLTTAYEVPKNDAFNLEIKPAVGASLGIARTAPPAIQTINILY
jgi:flagellin FlaB